MPWLQPEKVNPVPHHAVEDLVCRHALGDRNPLLLWQLAQLARAAFPGAAETPEQADLRFVRSRPGYEHLTDAELSALLREHPVLLAWERLEAALEPPPGD